MKKILFFASAVAGLILAGSCQRESLEPEQMGNKVTFTVATPGQFDTKVIADGENVDQVLYEIYKTDDGHENSLNGGTPLAEGSVEISGKKATITFDLLQDQNYTVIFWAQVAGKGHYKTDDLRKVSIVDPASLTANLEERAAFYKVWEFSTPVDKTQEVVLVRPFSQINLGTTMASLTPVQPGQTQGYEIDVEKSYMHIKGLSTTFNTLEATAEEADEYIADYTFALNETPAKQHNEDLTVNGTAYHYVGMNYIFVPANEALVELDYKIVTDKGEMTHDIINVPIKTNYRTNIIGNLLTKDVQFEIVVDNQFEAPEYVVGEEWTSDGNFNYTINEGASQTALAEVLKHADEQATAAASKAAGPVVTIDLVGDVYWETGAGIGSTPLLPEESLISEVVINGNGKTFTATGKGVGKIRLANGGKLTLNNLKIVDESVSYAEDSWEYGYLEFGGVIRLEECDVVNAIMVSGETAAFKSCSFNSHEDNQYAVWVDNGSAYFTDCTFKGARGLKTHEAYGSEVVKITVDGCTFDNLTKKPGMAIGTVNEETAITIKNSLFIGCQPGDQSLYIYETDTDVTTFTFVLENNEVHANPSAMVAAWVANAQAGDVVEVPAGEYTFPASSFKEGVTLKCAEGTVFTGQSSLDINGATVEGATFANESGTAVRNTINGTFKNCEFTGSNATRYCYAGETVVFEDCVFDGAVYGMHFDGGENPVTFRRCQLSGFNAFGSALTDLTFEDCVFKSTGKSGYNGANLWGKTTMTGCEFIFDGKASTEWIGLNATQSGKEITLTGCSVKDAEGNVVEMAQYFANFNNGAVVTVDGVELTLVKDGEGLASAFAAKAANIILMPGTFEGTFKPLAPATVKSASATEKAAIKGRVNIDGYADGIRFENVKFEISDASKVKNSFSGSQYKYPGIVMMYATAATFEGCEFACEMASGVCGINYGAHAAGKMLTVNNCKFTGDFYAIRTRTQFSVTNSEFDVYTDQGKLCAIWTWGNGNTWKDAVTFTGNKNVNANEIYSVQLSSTNFTYNNMTINVQNNTGFAALKDGLNTKCTYSDITFAAGSETFEF